MSASLDLQSVKDFLVGLQDSICEQLQADDPDGCFRNDAWVREEGGGGESRIFEGGTVFEKGGVNFSHVSGASLPPSATARRPQLAGASFTAMGVSIVVHPRNPHVPTSHANVRFLQAKQTDGKQVWWFGGGFDLTPYYPYAEDAVLWHQTAEQACRPFGKDIYPRFKAHCDRYFYLKHRDETRGIGGLFFDDYNEPGFEQSFGLTRAIGEAYMQAYRPIVARRKATPWGERERQFQLYRRGRYVEFNLIYDRGTLFGLQSGGRTESILMSLPPLVRWEYDWHPEPGSHEEQLYREFLQPRDWLQFTQEGPDSAPANSIQT